MTLVQAETGRKTIVHWCEKRGGGQAASLKQEGLCETVGGRLARPEPLALAGRGCCLWQQLVGLGPN